MFTEGMLDQRLPKTAQVYELIRSSIIDLRVAPGTALSEKDVCDQLGISRTPLREALLRLSVEKLVTIRPNARTQVSRIHLKDVLEGQLVREAIEPRCARLAARHYDPSQEVTFDALFLRKENAFKRNDASTFYGLDEEFHQLLCHTSGYGHLWQILRGAKGQLDRARRLAFPIQRHFDEVIAEHRAIYSCIKQHDEQGAERLLTEHINSIYSTLELLLNERADLFALGTVNCSASTAHQFMALVR